MINEPPSIYAKRILNIIETNATNRNNRLVLELSQNMTGPIDLERWTTEFIRLLNQQSRIGLADGDKLPLTVSADAGIKGINNTVKLQFLQEYQNTQNAADHPFQNASIVNSIGDGTCLIHSCFNALSETYRGLDEKYQQLIGLFFRKHVYAESKLLDHHQKARVKQLFADEEKGIQLENTFLDDQDVRNLTRLFRKNILVFQERKNPNGDQENQCRYFRINNGSSIGLYLQNESHYDTIEFSENTFEQGDEWIKEHFLDAYDVERSIPVEHPRSNTRLVPSDIILKEVTQFIGRETKPPLTPSDVLLNAASHLLAPNAIKLMDPDQDDNISDISEEEEQHIDTELVQDIYHELNEYLTHIYKIMREKKTQLIKTTADVSKNEPSASDLQNAPTTADFENNTKCNSKSAISVEIQTIEKDQFGNEVLNTTECI